METFSASDLLGLSASLVPYEASRALHALAPYVLETTDTDFDYEAFVRHDRATMKPSPRIHEQKRFAWIRPRTVREEMDIAWNEMSWEGESLEVVHLTWNTGGGCSETRKFVLATSKEIAVAFFTAVCTFTSATVDEQVMVFERGAFHKSADLYAAIRKASFDSLVLPVDLASALRTDFAAFFAAEETFAKYNIPHKRGALFVGPPGNGKTQAIKALVAELGKPCLYVKSIHARHNNDHESLDTIFSVARSAAPCVLVLEDLDALVDDDNRSFLLNELDGFADNGGLVTIATTNYPHQLDPALVDRPSRFDRLYAFPLPDLGRRTLYLERWSARLDEALRPSPRAIERIAEATNGFSFAYLKELATSVLLAWATKEQNIDALFEREAKKLAVHVRRGDVSRVLG